MLLLRYCILVIAAIACMPRVASAQLETSRWYFGDSAGIVFRGGPPLPLTNGVNRQPEGTSTLSDPVTGDLLFHTNGNLVWDRNLRLMPNGFDLGGHESSTQAALIVPMP